MIGKFSGSTFKWTKYLVRNPRRYFADETEGVIRQKILENSLLHVNRIGWNDRAIAAACHDLHISPASSRILENGIMDVIEYAMRNWQRKMSYELSQENLEEMKISERVRDGVKIRLKYLIPYISHWHQAMAIGAHPKNIAKTTKILWDLADEIWYIAGDRSMNYNWYTKRGILLGVYSTTELYMLQDRSENFEQTWRFLDSRIKDSLEAGKLIHNAGNIGNALFTGLSSLPNILYPYPDKVENDINRYRRPRDMDQDLRADIDDLRQNIMNRK